jgi:hypothetical protein
MEVVVVSWHPEFVQTGDQSPYYAKILLVPFVRQHCSAFDRLPSRSLRSPGA